MDIDSKRKNKQNRISYEARRREKADGLFLVYQQMGPTRSIEKLYKLCTDMGLRIGINTLKRYSVRYDWQQRLLEAQSKEAERREREVGKLVDDMNRQDAAMAQGMKSLVFSGIRWHHNQIRQMANEYKKQGMRVKKMLPMGFHDIAQLARNAQHIERLARGQATSKTEIWVSLAATVVREFVLIFMATNKIEDPDERENEFLRLGDEVMNRYYSETVRGQLTNERNLE